MCEKGRETIKRNVRVFRSNAMAKSFIFSVKKLKIGTSINSSNILIFLFM